MGGTVIYYLGRGGQILGMWILLVDVVTAGPMGPNGPPRLGILTGSSRPDKTPV